MILEAIPELEPLARGAAASARSPGSAFAAALEDLNASMRQADDAAAALALGKGNVGEAAIARAKADVALEIAAVAAARISGTISTLMQTQL